METRRRLARKSMTSGDQTGSRPKKRSEKKGKSWFTGVAGRCFRFSLSTIAFTVVCTTIWAFVNSPRDLHTRSFSLPLRGEFKETATKANQRLAEAKRLLPNNLMAPESIELQEDRIYTGTADGKVLEIIGGKVENWIKIGRHLCEGKTDPKNCGRPLGLRTIGYRKLIVADAYYGLCELDFNNDSVKQLVSAEEKVDGQPLTFFNDFDIHGDTVYFTHSSRRWNIENFNYIVLSGVADGRLIAYNRKSGKLTTILDNLLFANGVQVSKNGDNLYVAETGMARVLKFDYFHFDSKMLNAICFRLNMSQMPNPTVEYLIENLYCLPDNIRLSPEGNLWIACASVRTTDPLIGISMYDWLAQHAQIRHFMIKFIPRPFLFHLMNTVGSSHYGLALLVDNNGRYVKALHDPQGKVVTEISQVTDNGTHLFFGSFRAYGLPYLS